MFGLLAALLPSACGSLSTTELDSGQIAALGQAPAAPVQIEIDTLARPMVESGYTPGLVVGVLLPDGTTRFAGYGVTDQDSGRRPDADTLFAIGSLSKGFLAALTAQLVEQGVLSWDETLPALLPPGTPLSEDARRITLRQLATHTSGLPRQPITLRMLRYFVEYLFDGENFYRHFNAATVFDYLAEVEIDEPGQPQYSNIGYALLGHAVERRTGRSLEDLLEDRLARPLGLACTGYLPEALPCHAQRAFGHAGDQPKFIARGKPAPDWRFTPLMRGSAALSSTARDLLRFAAAHLNERDSALAANLRVQVPRDKEAAATAWVVDRLDGHAITYQIGIVAGYTSYMGLDLERKTAVVVLQNAFNWDNSLGHKLLLRLAVRPDSQPINLSLSQ
ncbi:serine hydrolase domain-containing protein [Paramagnetospirillum kuznetsovii]|uniref:serine hydrolase domain-containing protein n=1 Tax=Paramagnetospirillum kuznetsovii TaxID=2053833 RepID=UPI00195F5088|nr:serine hydrolase domain-containing protein [Paramagnetospirillum kuznetsovii]